MDTLLCVFLALAGLCSYVFCTMQVRASFSLSLFSWIIAIPWLGIYAIRELSKLDAIDLTTWNNASQVGEFTLILAVIGLSLVTAGGKRHARQLR